MNLRKLPKVIELSKGFASMYGVSEELSLEVISECLEGACKELENIKEDTINPLEILEGILTMMMIGELLDAIMPDEEECKGDFKVGDYITGLAGNGCEITSDKAIMEVLEIKGAEMKVKVWEHTEPCCVNTVWAVVNTPEQFKKVDYKSEDKYKLRTRIQIGCIDGIDEFENDKDYIGGILKIKEIDASDCVYPYLVELIECANDPTLVGDEFWFSKEDLDDIQEL